MQKVHLTIHPDLPAGGAPIDLETFDVATALAIADINWADGRAEIRQGDRRIVRLARRGNASAGFWEVF